MENLFFFLKKSIKNFFKTSRKKRLLFFLIGDFLIFLTSLYLSELLIKFPIGNLKFIFWLFIIYSTYVTTGLILKIFSIPWRFFSFYSFFVFLKSFVTSFIFVSIFYVLIFTLFKEIGIPYSIILLCYFISFSLLLLLRFSKRIYLEIFKKDNPSKKRNVIIIGAGSTGEKVARAYKEDKRFNVLFFLDDDNTKIGTYIHGIPVRGPIKSISDLSKLYRIDLAVIAIPSLHYRKIREIYELLRKNNVNQIKIVPSIWKVNSSEDLIKTLDIKNISIEDLLFREPVDIELDKLKEFFNQKTIFVSGAGGSIGSEIVRQLVNFQPWKIIAFDIDETELHNLTLELNDKLKDKNIQLIPIVGDIKDLNKLKKIFEEEKPQIVFHAAAYKHVPMMEYFPEEAVKTNIFGTYNLAKVSVETNVEKFINISTDKAVNPTSVMGATKRFAEIICKAFNKLGKTKFISVRFGNVLGSRGSVLPIFLEQIKKGGPITVTHPDMKRYFMSIPEAVLLVFQAAYMGKGGEVFVLDMGKPIKIVKLAEQLVKLHGLEPYKDIDIVFTGLRPGEKLFEELLTAEEGSEKTYHEKIFIAKSPLEYSLEEINNILEEFEMLVNKLDRKGIKKLLKKYIPFYKEKR